ncbi:MAG: T9SS response regulator signal transducer PorX [bacterium]
MNSRLPFILWVDDEVDLLKSQIVFLEKRGYKVSTAASGADAIKLVSRETFDLIFLDQMMPGMDGLATLVKIKEMRPFVPVVMVTKVEEEDLIDEALRKNIDDFLLKPISPVQIISVARRILESRQIRQEELTRKYAEDFHRVEQIMAEARTWSDWIDIHTRLSEWDVLLDELGDPGLIQSHLDQRRQCNIEFSSFIEKVYPHWLRGNDRPPLSVDVIKGFVVPHLLDHKKVYFIVIDCLRLDQWLTLEPLVANMYSIKRDYYYSILPTATPYARNAIFAGMFPAQLAKRYPNYWDENAPEEIGKNRYEKQLLEEQIAGIKLRIPPKIKYIKVYDAEDAQQARRQVPTLKNVELIAMVFNFVDIVAHTRSESVVLKELLPTESAYRSLTKSWFTHSVLFEILKKIVDEKAVVVVTTDHGSVLSRRSAVVLGDRDTSPNVRYKFGSNLNCNADQAIKVKDPEDYFLPRGGINKNYIIAKEDYYFVYPTNQHEYERYYKDTFQHGGVSMEEMILPLITMVPS